jgi:multidrug efflux system membrane fusion protein
MPVGVAVAEKGDIPITLEGLGTVTPLATVTVKTQINGQLTQVVFKDGREHEVDRVDSLDRVDRVELSSAVHFRPLSPLRSTTSTKD